MSGTKAVLTPRGYAVVALAGAAIFGRFVFRGARGEPGALEETATAVVH